MSARIGRLLAAIQSQTGRRVLGIATLSLVVRLVPACLVYGSFDVGGWELVQRYAAMGQNPYLTGKLNWPPLWLLMLLYAQKLQTIYNLPSHFAVKIVPCAADTAIAIVLFLWFVKQSGNPSTAYRRALWYALNPVAIATCALQGQFESLPSLFTLLAILAAKVRTEAFPRSSVLWLGLGGLAKTWPILLAPAFMRTMRSRTQRVVFCLLAAAPAVLTAAVLYLQDPATIQKHVINYHGRSGAWGLTAVDSWLPERISLGWNHLLLWILYAAWAAVYARTWRRGSPGQIACLGVLTFYVFSPGFGPQYTVWILGIGFAMDWQRARLYTVLASFTLAVMYVYSPFNGEYFDFVRREHTPLFWATLMNAHHVRTGAVLFLPLWGFCIWWWWSLLRDILRIPATDIAPGPGLS